MKKIEYQAPEMEVIKLNIEAPLLTFSDGTAEQGGEGDPTKPLD